MSCVKCVIKEFTSEMCNKLLGVPSDCPLRIADCQSKSELAKFALVMSYLKKLREEYKMLDDAREGLWNLRNEAEDKIKFLEQNFNDLELISNKNYIPDFLEKVKSKKINISNLLIKAYGGGNA